MADRLRGIAWERSTNTIVEILDYLKSPVDRVDLAVRTFKRYLSKKRPGGEKLSLHIERVSSESTKTVYRKDWTCIDNYEG